MFEYKLLADYGINANIRVGETYNQYYIVTGVKSEPCFVKDLVSEDDKKWELTPSKRVYPQLLGV